LEYPNVFSRGAVEGWFVPKLKTMVEQVRSAYPHYGFRGVMFCSFCGAAGATSPGPTWSQENIFVPGVGVVYVAPGGIVHYVEAHSYLPPTEFVEAVLRCPDLRSSEYREALCRANMGNEAPLESHEAFSLRVSRFGKK
jgi:hypothetical protein